MSKITYTGADFTILIGKRHLVAGDVVTDGKPAKGEIGTDAKSLKWLAERADFDGTVAVTTKAAKLPPSDFEEDSTNG